MTTFTSGTGLGGGIGGSVFEGKGAPGAVEAVFGYAFGLAETKQAEATKLFKALQGLLNQPNDISPRAWEVALNSLNANIPDASQQIIDPSKFADGEFTDEYAATQARVATEMAAVFSDYFTNWFPLDDTYILAQEWAHTVLADGGSGINPYVEAQIWNRDRTRLLDDSMRAEDDAMTAWAARGFPIPPGAAAYQLLQIRRDTQKAIADVSRAAAIKSFETEIENIRIAVGRAIEFRSAVLDNAEKFFRIQLFPERYAQETESAKFDIRNKFRNAAEDLYKLQIEKFEQYTYRNKAVGLDDDRRVVESNLATKLTALKYRVDAAIAEAQATATQAAAALNALHAQASISGSSVTTESLD